MNDNVNLKSIGQNIQKARLKKGLTQEQLAEICGVSNRHIGLIERGLSAGSIPLIIKISNVLDVSANVIFGKTINSSNDTISILPDEVSINYLKLKNENKDFVIQTINHLYTMQKTR